MGEVSEPQAENQCDEPLLETSSEYEKEGRTRTRSDAITPVTLPDYSEPEEPAHSAPVPKRRRSSIKDKLMSVVHWILPNKKTRPTSESRGSSSDPVTMRRLMDLIN